MAAKPKQSAPRTKAKAPASSTKSTPKKERAKDTSWHTRFLEILGTSCNVTLACRGAGIDRTTAYNHREYFPDFAKLWDTRLTEAIEILEAEAWNRARKQSDTLMIFLLKAHRPEKYRERLEVVSDPINWEIVPDEVLDQYVDGKITEDDVRRAIVARTRKG